MEQGLGSDPNGSIDRSRVLEVKPLRCLVPVFPNQQGLSSISTPQPTPFVCVPPTGPFPPGVQPFYPFLAPNESGVPTRPSNFGFGSSSIPAPVPLNAFRTPPSQPNGYDESQNNQGEPFVSGFSIHVADAEDASNSGKRKSRAKKVQQRSAAAQNGEDFDVDSLVNNTLSLFKLKELDDFRRATGDNDTVATVLLVYDLLRRRLTQFDEAKEASPGLARRPDLKAANLLMTKGVRTNNSKKIGHVPGVAVGDIFFFRMELCVVGLHAPSMAGIDYMSVKATAEEEPIAVSIVSSGGYDDSGNDSDVLIYSGSGGVQRRDGQMFDQKLERGNLALEKSLHRSNDVRVIRGIKDSGGSHNGKIYVYDGVYKIQESWAEKNQSGCNVFKYKLVRVPGQPEAFSLWKSVQQWKDGTVPRAGVILPDLTSGAESPPVILINDVDGEKGPAHFTYISSLRYSQPFPSSKPSSGCQCSGGCKAGDAFCPCNMRNDGFAPYSSNGVLLSSTSVIHECGMSCSCPPNCRNRISQAGPKVRLEVFKTKNRGWGLRSWDPIRAGSFICEYAGDVIKAGDFANGNDDYIFDATRYYEPLEPVHNDSNGSKAPFPLVISSKNCGNVARFMNHSCSPTVYWKPVLRETNNDAYLHIAFFAIRHVPPMMELTFDYGIVPQEKGDRGKKRCVCGSVKCRGYFY